MKLHKIIAPALVFACFASVSYADKTPSFQFCDKMMNSMKLFHVDANTGTPNKPNVPFVICWYGSKAHPLHRSYLNVIPVPGDTSWSKRSGGDGIIHYDCKPSPSRYVCPFQHSNG